MNWNRIKKLLRAGKVVAVQGVLIVLMGLYVLLLSPQYVFAGEKEELQWKARALVAEVNLYQSKLNDAQKAIGEFVKELDQKGYMATQDGNIVEKPKPQPKEEVPKKTPTPK